MDPDLFKQALLNLMINAVQAMENAAPPDDGPPPPRELMLRLASPDAEDLVRLHVIDTGPGMDSETLAKVFRAFYTTKQGGSGLNLHARRVRHFVLMSP